MANIKFPKDFYVTPHKVVPGAVRWLPKKSVSQFVSIVGGGVGIYGDGVNTFEIMIDNDVEGFLSKKEINKLLKKVF